MNKYEIVKSKNERGFLRLLVRRKDKKLITKGCLGYYFDDMFNAEKHLQLLVSKKWFKDNNVEDLE
jgi:hypothetical protein